MFLNVVDAEQLAKRFTCSQDEVGDQASEIDREIRLKQFGLKPVVSCADKSTRSWIFDAVKPQRDIWNSFQATRCKPFVAQIVFVWSETDRRRHAM